MSSEPDPIANSRRKARRAAKLPPDAACVLCGEATPEALLLVDRTVLEQHHPLGETYAPNLVVPLCRNCHAVETERMRDLGVELTRAKRPLPETLASVLAALGGFLIGLGRALLAWSRELADLTRALDREFPGWRELPEANP
jgi:hypothetical protein